MLWTTRFRWSRQSSTAKRKSGKYSTGTFTNHQAASCVCSPARSTIYTGQHIQRTGIFDNANSLWQADMSRQVQTIGHRMGELGYHVSYQGKWHLSVSRS
jgi:arylsulfatase A-like enzyme